MATPYQHDSAAPPEGTTLTGPPAGPISAQAAQGQAQQQFHDHNHNPYLVYSPAVAQTQNPCEYAVKLLDSWTQRAEGIGRNLWNNLKTGPSVSGTTWGKMNLATKAIREGGFESLFRQSFPTDPTEKLKKTFACYLSTTTGPVSGTLYLTTARVAFCSDRPLSFPAPPGQNTWSYYKVSIPLGNIENVNPMVTRHSPSEKYIHVTTVDGHEFFFVGLVNFEKATHHLLESISTFKMMASNISIR